MAVVGYFRDPETRRAVLVFNKKDEAPDAAIKRVAADHGVDVKDVKLGEPPIKKKEAPAADPSIVPPPNEAEYDERAKSSSLTAPLAKEPVKAPVRRQLDVRKTQSREALLKVPAAFTYPDDKPLPSIREKA